MDPTLEDMAEAMRHLEERLERQAVLIEVLMDATGDPAIRGKAERALVDWETDRAGVPGD